ncbi:hypothetical protein KUCAC02_019800, partial [Chaenocephalus aceratus]
DGGEQEDRSPMATRDFSVRSSVSKLQPQTSVCHPGCCWPASTLSIACMGTME